MAYGREMSTRLHSSKQYGTLYLLLVIISWRVCCLLYCRYFSRSMLVHFLFICCSMPDLRWSMEQKSLSLGILGHLSQLLIYFLFVVSCIVCVSVFSLLICCWGLVVTDVIPYAVSQSMKEGCSEVSDSPSCHQQSRLAMWLSWHWVGFRMLICC